MFENTECDKCVLHTHAKHRCLPSQGDQDCKLAIYFDSPNWMDDKRGKSFVSENADFVRFCLRRMSIDPDDVYFDYIVKCYPAYSRKNIGKLPGKKEDRMACVRVCSEYRFASLQKLPHLKAMVGLGSLCSEAFTLVKEVGKRAGADWEPASMLMRKFIDKIWIGFSPGLVKEKPAEAGSIYRVIWMAAEEAGLKPEVNLSIKPYEFDV